MSSTVATVSVEQAPQPIQARSRWAGLGNLLRKELGRWWSTRRWWVHAVLWLGMITGISTIVMTHAEGALPADHRIEIMLTYFGLSIIAVGIGIVISVQGSVVGEKELGTAAWIMSKPVSRASFILAKILAETASFLVVGVGVPAAAFLVAARFLMPVPLDSGRFALGLAVSAVAAGFYVTLTIALGTLFNSRGPVAGIGLGLILSGQLLKNVLPANVVAHTPWGLSEAAAALAVPIPVDWNPYAPVLVTVALTLVLGVIAIWRFGREEF